MTDTITSFALGDFVQERTTGFVGMIFGRTEFLHGEVRCGILPIASVAQEHGGHGANTHRALEWIDERALRPVPPVLQQAIDKRRREHREARFADTYRAAATAE
ncbi:hypothetical protein [Sphingorhabdus pulchriflava]|uniref:hypothetical protein n=1 Tax=Sphingorhabdus pulchriflava TaxID=2292257 RepID=UPI0011C02670|nr:hypothetical protein [Sphingorhabdus pulchriflava]